MFDSLKGVAGYFDLTTGWPSLDDYGAVFKAQGLRIHPVAQAEKASSFEEQYEPRVYLKGELQTRLENWHDFFNALVWLRFPQTKAILNELHYFSSLQRDDKTNRSKLENAITLFDECGAIVISGDESLLQMIRDHQWQALFVEQRNRFDKDIKCYVFGHAMYEKALNPYLGMTTNTLLIHSPDLLTADMVDIDRYVANYWKQSLIQSAKELKPFPVLGIPGWFADNEQPSFYENTDYFRPRRSLGED